VANSENVIEEVKVSIGILTEREVQVIDGCKEGDLVLTTGVIQAKQGMTVNITTTHYSMAGLSSISINRPVLVIVLSITIVLFVIIGISFLGIREYPSVDPPIINVRTSYVGANADVIEAQITEPLEESINGISGIKSLTSISN